MAEHFGERMKRFRDAAGLTQEGLARKVNLSVSFVSKLERQGLDPSWSAVQAIAAALGVDCTAFSGCEDVSTGEPEKSPAKKKGKK